MKGSPQATMLALYRRLWVYVRPYWRRLIVGLVAGLIGGGALWGLLQATPDMFLPFEQGTALAAAPAIETQSNLPPDIPQKWARYVKIVEDRGLPVFTADRRLSWQVIVLALMAVPMFAILKGAANFVNRYVMRWIGAKVCQSLRNDLFEHLQHQSLKYFGRTDVGRLISSCTNDVTYVENVLSNTLSDATRAPIEIVVSIAFAVYFAIQQGILELVGIILLVFPLCIVPVILLGQVVRRHTARALGRVGDLVSRMHENFTGMRVVKAFHMEEAEIKRFLDVNARYFKSVIRALRAELAMGPLMESVAMLLTALFFVTCYAKGIRLSQIAPMAVAAVIIYRPLKQLSRIQPNLSRGAAALTRIYEILDVDDRLVEAAHPRRVETFQDRIAFESVGFAYEIGGQPVLADVSFELKRGQVVALVGETGSGKSTMANLLARFYDPTAGCVRFDGIDMREVETASLRRLITVVTQDTILFNDTIAANIAYGSPWATQAQIEDAARQANAHAFIIADPAGYDRVVGEKGFVLSGGEKQRIALARAIVRNPPILILDEATSALDTVTEALIQEAIARVMQSRTVFAIAHRLSTVRHADLILVIENGRIAERGTHEELHAAGGRYRKLCDMQVLGG